MSTAPLIFSREAVRTVDARAIADYGIPGIVLMENAARGAADHIRAELERLRSDDNTLPGVMLIAGGGNNGGDAFAIARHLHNAGIDTVTVSLKPAEAYAGEAATNLAILDAMGLPHHDAGNAPVAKLEQVFNASVPGIGLIVDGVFGTGLTSAVREPCDAVIRWTNDAGAAVVSLDIPSGLDCDSGEELGVAVRADLTVTFVGYKRGFVTHAGQTVIGRVAVVDIGAPRELVVALADGRGPKTE